MALQLDLFNVDIFFFFKDTQVCEGIAIVLKVLSLKVLPSFKRVYDKNILGLWDFPLGQLHSPCDLHFDVAI